MYTRFAISVMYWVAVKEPTFTYLKKGIEQVIGLLSFCNLF